MLIIGTVNYIWSVDRKCTKVTQDFITILVKCELFRLELGDERKFQRDN